MSDAAIITCSISGSLANREQCPAIPYTPEEYGAEARRIVDEGGVMVHIHARKPDGTPSYETEDFDAITRAIKAEVGDAIIINYSTGALGVSMEQRIAYLRALRPEVAAVNMGSMNYAKYSARRREFVFDTVFPNPFSEIQEFLRVMKEEGIRPEHECFDVGHVGSLAPLIDMGLLDEQLHVDLVMGVMGGVPPTARNLAAMADNVPAGAHWGLIGIGRVQWPLIGVALGLGGSIRVGLEDNFYLPDGTMATSNGELVARARRLTEDLGRRPATVAEARGMLGVRKEVGGMTLPLEGLRVLDLSRLLPGPFCSLLLADYGAEVVKVEDTGMGDYVRWAVPSVEGVEDSAKSVRFLALNRNKSSVRLNLKDPAGKEAFLKLVEGADVVLESFRPGVMDRLGVGYEALRERNPGIVLCAISGYGADGPFVGRAGHDMNYLGLIGLLGITGDEETGPVQAGGQIADIGGGALMAAFGILTALRERDRSGEGQFVDVSMADGALSWLAMDAARALLGEPQRRGSMELGGQFVCYRPYRCADGWVTLGALEPKFFQNLCRGVDREDLLPGQFEGVGSATHAQLQALFLERTRAEWGAFNDEHDCCLEPVLELEEALGSELVQARGMVVELDQPGAAEPVKLLGPPVKLSRTPADPHRRPAPGFGEDTAAELRAAGLTDEDVAALFGSGAAMGLPDAGAGPGGSFLS